MKCLSIRQPWAFAAISLGKPVENRDWRYPPKYRGPLLIHASKTFDREGYAWIVVNARVLGVDPSQIPPPSAFPCGGIVGRVDLTDVVTHSDSPWFCGPLGLVMANPKPLKFVPYSGKLGIFDVPDEILSGGL